MCRVVDRRDRLVAMLRSVFRRPSALSHRRRQIACRRRDVSRFLGHQATRGLPFLPPRRRDLRFRSDRRTCGRSRMAARIRSRARVRTPCVLCKTTIRGGVRSDRRHRRLLRGKFVMAPHASGGACGLAAFLLCVVARGSSSHVVAKTRDRFRRLRRHRTRFQAHLLGHSGRIGSSRACRRARWT